MNAQDHGNTLALAVWRLAEAESLERKAALHRKAAAAILGSAHAEFMDALGTATVKREMVAMAKQEVRP